MVFICPTAQTFRTLAPVLPVQENCKNSHRSTRDRKMMQGQPRGPGEQSRYKNGGIPDEPACPVQCKAEPRCTWCRMGRAGQSPAGTALSAHLSPGKHLGSLAFLQPLTPLAFWAVFAGQTVKNITFYVSKIHNKTIKGCMALQCIVTSIKIVVTCSKRSAPAFWIPEI